MWLETIPEEGKKRNEPIKKKSEASLEVMRLEVTGVETMRQFHIK
jgi:hypothetical protein